MENKTLLQKSKLPPDTLGKAAINLAKAIQKAKKSKSNPLKTKKVYFSVRSLKVSAKTFLV
jgi:hypothetical protein